MPQKFLVCCRLRFAFFLLLTYLVFSPQAHSSAHAPEISDGLVWINSAEPIKIQQLRGKFVLVYFWNYSVKGIQGLVTQCRELQEKFSTQLVIIGIHTGKALNTDVLNDRVVDVIGALRIRQPVAIDDQMQVLQDFQFRKFPSAVLLAPDGEVLFKKIGSDNLFYFFNRIIEKNIPQFQNQMDLTVHDFQKIADVSVNKETVPPNDKNALVVTEQLPQTKLQVGGKTPGPEEVTEPAFTGGVSNESVAVDQNERIVPNDTGSDTQEIAKAPLDIKNFSGQVISIDREYSNRIRDIKFNFGLGPDAQILGDQKSFVRVYTEDSAIIAQQYLSSLEFRLPVWRELSSKRIYVEAVFYYCTHTDKALCRIKNVVFSVSLAEYPKQEDIEISYNIPE